MEKACGLEIAWKINDKPNQCRKYGIEICDDPTNPHKKLVIEASEYLFIPITTEGSTCGIVAYPTNDNELRECHKIILSDEFDWDPSNIFVHDLFNGGGV